MNIQVENYIRVESANNDCVRIVVEVGYGEYTRIICENWAEIISEQERRAQVERENEADRLCERQWYANNETVAGE